MRSHANIMCVRNVASHQQSEMVLAALTGHLVRLIEKTKFELFAFWRVARSKCLAFNGVAYPLRSCLFAKGGHLLASSRICLRRLILPS